MGKSNIKEIQESFRITKCESTKIPVNLSAWMDLTRAPDFMREKIRKDMKDEISGNSKTGFSPYQKDGEIYFDQRWLLTIGEKQ